MLVTLVVVCALAPVPQKKPALDLTVALDKVTYKPGDKVVLAFTLKNATAGELWIGDGYPAPENHEVGPGRHFELSITDADGTALHFWNNHLTEGRTSGIRVIRTRREWSFRINCPASPAPMEYQSRKVMEP